MRGTPGGTKNIQDVDLSKKFKTAGQEAIKEETVSKEVEIPSTEKFSPEKKYKVFRGDISSKLSLKARDTDESLPKYNLGIALPTPVVLDSNIIYQGQWEDSGVRSGKGVEIRKDGS